MSVDRIIRAHRNPTSPRVLVNSDHTPRPSVLSHRVGSMIRSLRLVRRPTTVVGFENKTPRILSKNINSPVETRAGGTAGKTRNRPGPGLPGGRRGPPPGSDRAVMTTATKVRLRFAKRDDLRLVSHHDLMRCLERMLRRAAIPMAHSQGFNPRPKVVFTLALALGIEGCQEVVELDLAEPMEPSEVLRRLADAAPPGFVWLDVEAVPHGPAGACRGGPVRLRRPRRSPTPTPRARWPPFWTARAWPYTRHRPDRDRTVAIDLRPFVLDAGLEPSGVLRFRMKMLPGGSARPEEVIDALGLRDLLAQGSILIRTEVELLPEPRWVPGLWDRDRGLEVRTFGPRRRTGTDRRTGGP